MISNVGESNPIMSRIKTQRKLLTIDNKPPLPVVNKTPDIVQSTVEDQKPKVYKPPIRSSSSKPAKNVSSTSSESVTTTMSSVSSRALDTEPSKYNGKAWNKLDKQYEELNNYMENLEINKKTEFTVNTYTGKLGGQPPILPFSTSTHKSNSGRVNSMNINPTLDSLTNNLGLNQLKNNQRFNGLGGSLINNIPSNNLGINTPSLNTTNSLKNFYPLAPKNSFLPQSQIPKAQKVTPSQQYIINLEDLMLLEEKLDEIMANFNNTRPAMNECFDWWNFYFNCSLCGKLEFYFRDEVNKLIIREYTNLELLAIIICYDSSHDIDILTTINVMLKSILSLLHHNFLIVCEYILSKVSSESQDNMWVSKLRDLIENKMPLYNPNYKSDKNNGKKVVAYTGEIKSNNSSIYDYIRIVLKNYPKNSETSDILFINFKNISKINITILNELFRTKIMRVLNKNASVLASVLINSNENNLEQVAVPYLKKESIKEYTLVLDLDETLIHFKIDAVDENKGLLRLRPGIYEFLDAMSAHYELIVFTAATQDYADPILDAIEQDKLYFDYRLYRQHAIIFENDFVKDISRLGRDLSKIIIIDNMPQNFRLQKENGIFIKTFYGEDPDDCALIDLIPILTKIAEDKTKDIRISLQKFRDEILKRISSNIEKQSSHTKQQGK